MLYRDTISVCSQIHIKHSNTLCEQNLGFVSVKTSGKYSNHWSLEGMYSLRLECGLSVWQFILWFCYVFTKSSKEPVLQSSWLRHLVHPKRWYPHTSLHGVTNHKTVWFVTDLKPPNFMPVRLTVKWCCVFLSMPTLNMHRPKEKYQAPVRPGVSIPYRGT